MSRRLSRSQQQELAEALEAVAGLLEMLSTTVDHLMKILAEIRQMRAGL